MTLLPRGPRAVLALEDGSTFSGTTFGAESASAGGEVVFHTGMTGYPEILTDPSYRRQIVALTYPHAGNYGLPPGDAESAALQVSALVVHRLCRHPSGVRPAKRLERVLADAGIPGLEGVDTRALTRCLRERGALRGVLATVPGGGEPPAAFLEETVAAARGLAPMEGAALALEVGPDTFVELDPPSRSTRAHLALLHYGAKRSIPELLRRLGCRVTLVPASTPAGAVFDLGVEGVVLSNGPGDPAACVEAIAGVRELLGRVPMLGICLGHQILALAAGARTYKLPFGHHGANHPVREARTGRVLITSQNHGFGVLEASLAGTGFTVSHRSLYDGTVEGIASDELRAWSVQFHPEAAPGPHDARGWIEGFLDRLQGGR